MVAPAVEGIDLFSHCGPLHFEVDEEPQDGVQYAGNSRPVGQNGSRSPRKATVQVATAPGRGSLTRPAAERCASVVPPRKIAPSSAAVSWRSALACVCSHVTESPSACSR